jgi:hypothetical protein
LACDKYVFRQERNRRILALWNIGDYTLGQIGVVFGLRPDGVGRVLNQARLAGHEVLTIDAAERGRRAGRSRRLWRDGGTDCRSETGVMTPEASQQVRTLWLAGFSAVRIVAVLDIPITTILAEARRLDLPCRCRRRKCPRHSKQASAHP